ncbi:MAG: phosphotransferase family protein [Candidatus Dormibacteraeota bacterium]|nr:phosphotransferase family protein [Candidatus Dormibacteraeota bacterium]
MTSPPGLDLDALARHLAPIVGAFAGPLQGEVIAGGRSNLTYVVTDGNRRWVVRRPPLAHVLPTAHDMRREYTMQSALATTDIPVAQLVTLCDDESVLGAQFYVMEFVDGHVVRNELPKAFQDSPATRQAMSQTLVDTLVRLHALDPNAIGLGDFGHPEGFLGRQVQRWWQQWEASKTRPLPAMDELHARLERTVPQQSPSGIVHGDYRLDNVMFAPRDPSRIVAVVDWEMSTIGDPLCDLGLLLVYWADNEEEAAARTLHGRAITCEDGFLRRDEIVDRYRRATTRDLASLDWYIALGAYKLAIIAEGITARFLMGMTVGEGFEQVGTMVPVIVENALVTLNDVAPRA